ncbi:MAG: hypothetical protein Q4F66_09075, partial [Clostridium sp.]|nr:hypothetical protein [Clostridium sp.]
LEGDSTTEYYLRKDNMMLVVSYSEGKYYLNGAENQLKMMMSNGQVYVPVSFLTDVLKYTTEVDGNSTLIGSKAQKNQINDTYPTAKWNNENGSWYYVKGSTKVTGWAACNNAWYFMNAEGQMQTGWVKDNGNWYFLNENGEMATGWIESNGQNYYLNENGIMASNTTVDGYKLAENGVCIALY